MGKELDIYGGPGNELAVAPGAALEVAPEVIDAEIVDEHYGEPYVELSENNSGGGWWLSEDDWLALEAKGWVIEWAEEMAKRDHLFASSFEKRADGKLLYMGARAREAKRYGVSMNVARAEFQDATGQHPDEEGCECCGQPHYFSARDAEGNYTY